MVAFPPTTSSVLIVDDNAMNLDVLFTYLDSQGFEVFVALSGIDALEQINYITPDIILLDVMMPDLDGFEVCQRLKQHASTKNIPIIFMTALADSQSKAKGFQVGGADYITKPIQYEELLIRVNTQLTLKKLVKQNADLQQEIIAYKYANLEC
ncbi:MAG: response regulator [Chloroflexota bacterium]